ncbi:MAG: DUF5667 domain-containing protein [Anaerolineales bacterium]|jgi:hypothetical protein
MNSTDSYDGLQSSHLPVVKQLEKLKSVPPRDVQRALAGRAAFLQEASELAQAVSAAPEMRPIEWKQKIHNLFSIRKEHSRMFTTLTTLLVALTLIFGGGGLTVASAQNSLPDQPLYNLKLWTEELRFGLASDPQAAWQLSLAFADRRSNEIQAMFADGLAMPQSVQERYRSQVEQAVQLAAGLPDEQALPALEQTRQRLRLQEQALNQLQLQNDPQAQAARERIRLMLQERLNRVDADIERQQQRHGIPAQVPAGTSQPNATDETPITPLPASGFGPGPGDGSCDACTPNAGANNPWTTGTPTPGSSYGPGPGDGTCDTCDPTGSGSNPWTAGTPTPGSSYGPGPNPTQGSMEDGGKAQPTKSPAKTQAPQPGPTEKQQQSSPKDPGPQKSPGGGKNGG